MNLPINLELNFLLGLGSEYMIPYLNILMIPLVWNLPIVLKPQCFFIININVQKYFDINVDVYASIHTFSLLSERLH